MPSANDKPKIKNVVFHDEIVFNKAKEKRIRKNIDNESNSAKAIERVIAKKGASSMLIAYNASTVYKGKTKK